MGREKITTYKKCPRCGKIFEQRKPNGKRTVRIYCGYVCANSSKNPSRYWLGKKRVDMIGEKNPNWVESPKNDESKIWRWRVEYRLWREAVFKRDNWTCQKCGERGRDLHPHHILNFSSHIELRFSIDNGITLCVKHHRAFHKKYGNKNNSPNQISEYIY